MYSLHVLCSLNRSFSTKIRSVLLSAKNLRQNPFKSKHMTSFNMRPQVANDVVLFKYENPKFFIIMNLTSGFQCLLWSYLGIFLFQSLKESEHDDKKKQIWDTVFDNKHKYSTLLSLTAFFFGWTMFVATCFYSLRSIRELVLHKGGRSLTVVTYNIPGYNKINIPLSQLSAEQHRTRAKKFIPLKIKNKLFYYLIDLRGEFSNPDLYDYTAGIKRNF